MKDLPLVSIVIPVFGVEKYVGRCVDSIIQQTYPRIELIFIDDQTPDESIQIIKQKLVNADKLKNNSIIIQHTQNRGLAAARNTGVANADGKYILHLDSDDWIEADMIEQLVKKAESSNADIVICGYNAIRVSDITAHIPSTIRDKGSLIRKILHKSIPGSMWGKLISRKIYNNHLDAWSIEGINYGEDYATIPRILYYSKKIEYVESPLYNYNLTNQSSYTHNFSRKSMLSMLKADEVLYKFFVNKISESELDIMKLRTKTGMLKSGNSRLYKEIKRTYKIEQKRSGYLLSLKDRILLTLSGKGFDGILAKIVSVYLS